MKIRRLFAVVLVAVIMLPANLFAFAESTENSDSGWTAADFTYSDVSLLANEEIGQVSNLFVVCMGMGVTFMGLTCIIVLTILMGKLMQRFETEPPQPAAPVAAPAASPAAPADGLTEEVKVAILLALMQEPGFRMENVTDINIRRV